MKGSKKVEPQASNPLQSSSTSGQQKQATWTQTLQCTFVLECAYAALVHVLSKHSCDVIR